MGKVVERRKKKKKGRPSLLDLQKRTIKQLQHQQNNSHNNSPSHSSPNSKTATAVRRSIRRNPVPNSLSPEDDFEDQGHPEDDEEFDGRRREKKLKLVLRLPSQKSSLNSSSLNSAGSDSNAEVGNDESAKKKRKINAIGDGSGLGNLEKGEKSISGPNSTKRLQGTELDFEPSTQLPDEKLLLFILDRIQKKDRYKVFSEPVDPEELPDYHEVIEHPMDFATVRKKLASRAYGKLEEFEKDVFLICSNAMKYNAPDTIYFRQARSIQELAKKSFRNLRQDSDENELEPPKVVRRGRPPTKNLKQSQGQAFFERASSEFSDATLATGGENTKYYDLRKGPHLLEKAGLAEFAGKFPGSHFNEANMNGLAENRFERNDDFTGSLLKSYPTKNGKKLIILDENKRNTYTQFQLSAGGRELPVMNTFARERKQLMPVGIHTDNGYARSLARFAANLGPLAWQVASKKIERSLPAGVKFGRGWVVENDVIPSRPLLSPSAEVQVSLFPAAASSTPDIKEVKSLKISNENNASEKHMPPMNSCSHGNLPKTPFESAYTSSSPFGTNQSPEPLTGKSHNIVNSSANPVQPKPSFQVHKSPLQTVMNGYSNGAYGFHHSDQLGKLIGSAGVNLESSQMVDAISTTTNSVVHHPATPKNVIPASTRRINPGSSLSKHDEVLTPQTKVESVPPDLNVGFQSTGSPSSTRVDSTTHPDLALQL